MSEQGGQEWSTFKNADNVLVLTGPSPMGKAAIVNPHIEDCLVLLNAQAAEIKQLQAQLAEYQTADKIEASLTALRDDVDQIEFVVELQQKLAAAEAELKEALEERETAMRFSDESDAKAKAATEKLAAAERELQDEVAGSEKLALRLRKAEATIAALEGELAIEPLTAREHEKTIAALTNALQDVLYERGGHPKDVARAALENAPQATAQEQV